MSVSQTLAMLVLQSLLTACLIPCLLALTPTRNTRCLLSSRPADSVVRGNLMTQWSNLLLQGARFQGCLGCLQNRRATVPQCVDAFQLCFPGLHILCLDFSLVRPRCFCLCFEQDRGECKQAVLSRVVLNQAGVIQGI